MDSVLDGQLPSGVIDWGSGAWYLSGPWQALSGNSVSFNGDQLTAATFQLVSPRKLVKLDIYNGGDDEATVSLWCGDQHKDVRLSASEVRTVDTGWASACSEVGISTTNGWQTNFDNFVLE